MLCKPMVYIGALYQRRRGVVSIAFGIAGVITLSRIYGFFQFRS